jgi:hypothetical protein
MNINYYFIIIIFITLSFFIINNIINNNKINFENYSQKNNLCCFYAYYEKNKLYKDNFQYFLNNGILDNIDYYIIINGDSTVNIPKKSNIKVFYRENKGYDFGAYSYALKKLKKDYDYYFFINSSVRGPYLKNDSKNWSEHFLSLFTNDVKLVGTTINIFPNNKYSIYNLRDIYKKNKPYTHVQSMFFCIDHEYYQYLKNIHFFNENELNNCDNINYVIAHKEFGLSQHALKNNWNINSILPEYQNLDYRIITKDINRSSRAGDPYHVNAYFGRTINKYDVIFFKNNRGFG